MLGSQPWQIRFQLQEIVVECHQAVYLTFHICTFALDGFCGVLERELPSLQLQFDQGRQLGQLETERLRTLDHADEGQMMLSVSSVIAGALGRWQ